MTNEKVPADFGAQMNLLEVRAYYTESNHHWFDGVCECDDCERGRWLLAQYDGLAARLRELEAALRGCLDSETEAKG